VILFPSIEHSHDATLAAEKILAALSMPHRMEQHVLQVGVSIGISIFPGDGHDADTLIESADTAMYFAKENGRNNFKKFEQGMNAQSDQRQAIESDLALALERHEFVLHYQAKVDLQTNKIIGVEALIRWQHPKKGLMLPPQFLGIAEGCSLILPIGRWALREACLQAQQWIERGCADLTIAVNTSVLELRSHDFVEMVSGTLNETHLKPCHLEIEITEDSLMGGDESIVAVLNGLANLGVTLTIDDFGTGYSSLDRLSRLPIHRLKIDHTFIKHMTSNNDDATIVSAVICMGKSLNKKIIAEGVETPEQCAFLVEQNCEEGQGCYFGKPMAANDMGNTLKAAIAQNA
jgi:EAL domain-containing protein (putative c-di-GMP-specific phosphodiesterase class I)